MFELLFTPNRLRNNALQQHLNKTLCLYSQSLRPHTIHALLAISYFVICHFFPSLILAKTPNLFTCLILEPSCQLFHPPACHLSQ